MVDGLFFPRWVRQPAKKWGEKLEHRKFVRKRYPNGYPHIQPYEVEKEKKEKPKKPNGSILERRRGRTLGLSSRKGMY